jgi:hypothetical protein
MTGKTSQAYSVAESVVKDLDSNFILLGRINRNLFDRDGLSSFPGDG